MVLHKLDNTPLPVMGGHETAEGGDPFFLHGPTSPHRIYKNPGPGVASTGCIRRGGAPMENLK
jgi:hypothetical protein